jgi:hypothetical protein
MIFRFTASLTRNRISLHPSIRQVALRLGWSHDDFQPGLVRLVITEAGHEDPAPRG